MSLQISEQNGTFHLNGKLNASTLNFFNTYFEYNLSQEKSIVVNIDKVIEIDKNGVEAFRNFTKNAFLNQKVFQIVGNGCKEIYDDFNQTNVA
ncbi:hypothetical protein [Polaribacter aestuariivivens]|uniref:hypothetical protein n=1 Tax=Polaribacter aestuariivivens TaxID=2304626 RepID=UPI003F49AC27